MSGHVAAMMFEKGNWPDKLGTHPVMKLRATLAAKQST
jgi:hypothetical protein